MKLERNQNSILNAGIGLVIISLLGKVFGLIKQMVLAWAFGATGATDVYFVADGAIAMVTVVTSGALSVTLLSYYAKRLNNSTEDKRILIGNTISCGLVFSTSLMVVIILLSRQIAYFLAPSFSENQIALLSIYLRLLSVSIVIIILTSVEGAFLEGEKDFFPSKLQNIFISVVSVAIVVLTYKSIGINSILIGYLLGYFLHYCFVSYRLRRLKLLCFGPVRFGNDIKRIAKMSGMIIIGNSAVEINHLIDKMIASGLGDGSVSALYYGQIVSTDLVVATLVYSISAILVRDFSKDAAEGNLGNAKLKEKVNTVLGIYLPLSVLLLLLYIFYSKDIISILLLRGNFNQNALELTQFVVLGYCLCFVTIPIKDILMKAHYAFLDSKRPMTICIGESLLHVVISIFLSKQYGILGIALGTSFASVFSLIAFRFSIRKYIPNFKLFQLKQVLIIAASGVFIFACKVGLDNLGLSTTLPRRILIGAILSIAYMAILLLFKCPYVIDVMSSFGAALLRKGGHS